MNPGILYQREGVCTYELSYITSSPVLCNEYSCSKTFFYVDVSVILRNTEILRLVKFFDSVTVTRVTVVVAASVVLTPPH